METFATAYPVLFHDGEQEHDKGQVGLHSLLTFKRFQEMVAQRTGIPANKLSTVLVCRRSVDDTEKRQRLPVNGNTNFGMILKQHNPSRERDCHFLVFLKKSKKERKEGSSNRRRNSSADNTGDDDSAASRGNLSPPDERRDARDRDDTTSAESTPRSFPDRLSSYPTAQSLPSSHNSHNGSGIIHTPLFLGELERAVLKQENLGQNSFTAVRSSSSGRAGAVGQRVQGFSVTSSTTSGEIPTPTSSREDLAPSDEQPKVGDPDGPSLPELTTPRSFHEQPSSHLTIQPPSGDNSNGQQTGIVGNPQEPLFLRELERAVLRQEAAGLNVLVRAGNGSPALQLEEKGREELIVALDDGGNGLRATETWAHSHVGAGGGEGWRPSISSAPATRCTLAADLTRQQVQARASYLQTMQQPSLEERMSHLELSQFKGVLRGSPVRKNSRGESAKVCKLCSDSREGNSGPPSFHWCVDDAITKGFRGPSPAGPIGRPVQRSETEGASPGGGFLHTLDNFIEQLGEFRLFREGPMFG